MIDVSSYQGRVDWRKVHAAGVRHAYVKLTEGTRMIDGKAKRNVDGCRSAGIRVGVYHYAHPSSSALAEARHFLAAARGLVRIGDLPPALDLEVAEGHDWQYLNAWKAQWLHVVDAAIGRAAGAVFYSYLYFWKQMQLDPDRPVWGAAIGQAFTPPASWRIHQYSFTGRVDGISGAVDLDKILGDVPPVSKPI